MRCTSTSSTSWTSRHQQGPARGAASGHPRGAPDGQAHPAPQGAGRGSPRGAAGRGIGSCPWREPYGHASAGARRGSWQVSSC
eukprot:8701390-Alexandrium_andersonii.AAC.2